MMRYYILIVVIIMFLTDLGRDKQHPWPASEVHVTHESMSHVEAERKASKRKTSEAHPCYR